jgi:hypothetical protein
MPVAPLSCAASLALRRTRSTSCVCCGGYARIAMLRALNHGGPDRRRHRRKRAKRYRIVR